MATHKSDDVDSTRYLIQDLFIAQLVLAGVPQTNIRAVVGCGMDRVARIGKLLKPKKGKEEPINV
jgi:hypothetical protein